MIKRQQARVDPDNVQEAVRQGFASIERGDFVELQSREDLQRFFGDIIARGKKRLAAKSKAARG